MRISDWSSDVCSSDLLLVQKRMGQSSQTGESHCHLDPARRLEASNRMLGTAIHESIDRPSAPRGRGDLQEVHRFPDPPTQLNEPRKCQHVFTFLPMWLYSLVLL